MVAVGPNFFYTVTLPCTLWFLDRGKGRAGCPQPATGKRTAGERPLVRLKACVIGEVQVLFRYTLSGL